MIIGAGPTGLTLAAALAERGVRTTVIDRLADEATVQISDRQGELLVIRIGVAAP